MKEFKNMAIRNFKKADKPGESLSLSFFASECSLVGKIPPPPPLQRDGDMCSGKSNKLFQ